MLELFKAGGWLMIPLAICSILTVAIIIERFWSLQRKYIVPSYLLTRIWVWLHEDSLDDNKIKAINDTSPLGEILSAGLANRHQSREVTKENIEDVGRHVIAALEKHLNTLGTIAAISPLLGLLGTVIGMIKVFTVITTQGLGNPEVLAGGISVALITTATGLIVAIPSLIFYRYFKAKVDRLVIDMEQQAMQLMDALHGDQSQSKES